MHLETLRCRATSKMSRRGDSTPGSVKTAYTSTRERQRWTVIGGRSCSGFTEIHSNSVVAMR